MRSEYFYYINLAICAATEEERRFALDVADQLFSYMHGGESYSEVIQRLDNEGTI